MPMRIEWMLCMIQSLWFQRWAFAMMLPLAECGSLVRICVWSFGTVYQVQNLQLLSECNYSTEWIRFFYVFRPNRLTWLISGFWSRTTNNPKLNTRVYTNDHFHIVDEILWHRPDLWKYSNEIWTILSWTIANVLLDVGFLLEFTTAHRKRRDTFNAWKKSLGKTCQEKFVPSITFVIEMNCVVRAFFLRFMQLQFVIWNVQVFFRGKKKWRMTQR